MTVRTRKLGLRVAALAATALVLTACNDDGSSDQAAAGASSPAAAAPSASASATGKAKARPTSSGKPSSAPAAGDKAAQARTDKLALTVDEWDNYSVSDGDDDTSRNNYAMSQSCVFAPDGNQVKGLLATTSRPVRQDHESDATYANTEADQFTAADEAHREIQEIRDNDKRCPNYQDTDGSGGPGTQYSGVHAGTAPAVPGADEVYAEEGKAVYTTDQGRTKPRDFIYLMARKGTVVVKVYMDIDPNFNAASGKDDARAAMAKLAAKW
ncbi:hypothetical protein ACFY00_26285 [Kitasatospora sp. NPDC001540]|uniref:hypothetical protein n=1 Tax=Kitasatospora sp. NPDC001540 TaxID=3364014 RepID=UPI0036AE5A24